MYAHVLLQTVFETGSDFHKMKSRARFSLYSVSGLDFTIRHPFQKNSDWTKI